MGNLTRSLASHRGAGKNALTKRGLGATLVTLLFAASWLWIGTAPDPAGAVTGFHTSANSVRVRAGAGTQTAQINLIAAAGTPIDIGCQTAGETVSVAGFGTSPIWDYLNGYGGYISDLLVQETPYGVFDPAIPRCGIPTPPAYSTSAAVTIRSAPSFNATALGGLPANTAVTITCQNYGTAVNGSFIWDRVGSGFISDFFVNGTPFNAFAPGLPRCGLNYQPVDCSKELFLGVRGSGEPFGVENLGDTTSPVQVTRNLLSAVGARLDVAGTIYPANSVSVLVGDPAAYFSGISQGVAVLLANLRARTDGNVCGWQHTRSVLVGYSQGAMVVGGAIDAMSPAERSTILGVVTYGNPHYTPFVNGATGGSSYRPGVAGARLPYADGVNNRSRDYCRADIVCEAGSLNVVAHLGYVNPGPQVTQGVTFLRSLLGL